MEALLRFAVSGLASIATPAVVLQGNADELVKPIRGRHLAATLPHAHLVMLYGGHMQPYDHPTAIAAAVRALSGANPQTATAARSATSAPASTR